MFALQQIRANKFARKCEAVHKHKSKRHPTSLAQQAARNIAIRSPLLRTRTLSLQTTVHPKHAPSYTTKPRVAALTLVRPKTGKPVCCGRNVITHVTVHLTALHSSQGEYRIVAVSYF